MEPLPVQFADASVLRLQPIAESAEGRRFGVVLIRLVHQQPDALSGIVLVVADDFPQIHRGSGSNRGIVEIHTAVIERRRISPARRIFRAQGSRDLDSILRRRVINPVIAVKVPDPLHALHIVPDDKDSDQREAGGMHLLELAVDGGFCVGAVQEIFGADAKLPGQLRKAGLASYIFQYWGLSKGDCRRDKIAVSA